MSDILTQEEVEHAVDSVGEVCINRFIITGDWHLNFSKNKEWEVDRFYSLVGELQKVGDSNTILLLSGDIFDKPMPSLDEVKEFYHAIKTLSKTYNDIWLIDGNHERVDNKSTLFDYLPEINFKYFKEPKIMVIDNYNLYLVGHSQLNKLEDLLPERNSILISHFRCDIGIVKEEVDVGMLSDKFDYVIASDIHQHYKPYQNVEYTSQPYSNVYKPKEETGYIELFITEQDFDICYKELDLPDKIKLEMSAEEYIDKQEELKASKHLYKIVITDNVENIEELPIIDNVILSFKPKAYEINEQQEETMKEALQQKGFIDVTDILKKLIREGNNITDEQVIRAGENLIDMIVKGSL